MKREVTDITKYQDLSWKGWDYDFEGIRKVTEDATFKSNENQDEEIAAKSVFKFIDNPNNFNSMRVNQGRVFNPFTSMKKAARQYVTHKGSHLVEIDTANSQPLILVNYLIKNYYNIEPELKEKVSKGLFYELFTLERNEAKKEVFKLFFSKSLRTDTIAYKILNDKYPLFIKAFTKEYNKYEGTLAVLLQGLESNIWIERISRKCMIADIPHITIHDSVVFSGEGNINKVLDIIEDSFTMDHNLHVTFMDGKETPIEYQRDKGGAVTEFGNLLKPPYEGVFRDKIWMKPGNISSGYEINGEEIFLPVGALTIIASPTSHGKTTMLLNLALNASFWTIKSPEREVEDIFLFSYEEDSNNILLKSLNLFQGKNLARGGTNLEAIEHYYKTGNLSAIVEEKQKWFIDRKNVFWNHFLETGKFNINYTNYTSDKLIEAIRYLNEKSNVRAVFIDYMQLLQKSPDSKFYSRQEQLEQICIDLKNVAVETGLPIILAAQFNRTVTNSLKLLSTNIGEAGDVEGAANLIIGMWNNNFKEILDSAETKEVLTRGLDMSGTIFVKVLKNRNGIVGAEDYFNFNGNTGKISNKGIP